jgi:hypothetical protein
MQFRARLQESAHTVLTFTLVNALLFFSPLTKTRNDDINRRQANMFDLKAQLRILYSTEDVIL